MLPRTLKTGIEMIDWLTHILFNDMCGPAAVNWQGWLLLGGFFGSAGLFLGALIFNTNWFDHLD